MRDVKPWVSGNILWGDLPLSNEIGRIGWTPTLNYFAARSGTQWTHAPEHARQVWTPSLWSDLSLGGRAEARRAKVAFELRCARFPL